MKLPENASSRRARPWLGRGGSLVVCTPAAVALLEAVLRPQEGQLFDRDGAGLPPIVDLPAEATLPGGSTAATSRKCHLLTLFCGQAAAKTICLREKHDMHVNLWIRVARTQCQTGF